MPAHPLSLPSLSRSLAALLPLVMGACNPLETGSEMLTAASVKFSEGSPAVDGQTIAYTGSIASPSLDKFRFKMVFHVIADNSKNSGRAAFGTDAVQPIVDLHINAKDAKAITTSIPSFSVPGGALDTLDFPIEIPVSLIDRATARKIVNGDPIPYFLTGSLKFNVFEGTALQGTGTSKLDLASGEIETRPSSSVTQLLIGLL